MAQPPPPCYLLQKLPPELRNNIYEVVFTFDHVKEDHTNDVDVWTAVKKLPNSLLFTCRTIQAEATKMFAASLKNFWSTHNFVITEPACYYGKGVREPDLKPLQKLTDDDIRCMKSLRFQQGSQSWCLLHNRGGWRHESHLSVSGHTVIIEDWLRPRYYYSQLGYRYIDHEWEEFDNEEELFKACEENEMAVPLLHQLCWFAFEIGGYQDEFGEPAD
ncbi:hypothetical protein AC578_5700 [Pseudocercospora eumusae]|uniref:Uncharacterized protein n=1 Tax=Pseudocercospora eumusae TaxID=321146 RepID=A0A139HEP5_9PEZI|nr:hypothetical protein AC578_5700 [Pseudocercospora eumusae]